MNGLRRSHIKSRHGCGQCKKRRLKCDEKPPRCGRCRTRGLKCDYEDRFRPELLAPSSISASHHLGSKITFEFDKLSYGAVPAPSTVSKDSTEIPLSQRGSFKNNASLCRSSAITGPKMAISSRTQLIPDDLHYRDYQVMHHYSTVTVFTITSDSRRLPVWQHLIPSVAQSSDYVRHALLAFSALHMTHLQPENQHQHLSLASRHQCTALSRFRKSVNSITAENADAVYLFSLLVLLSELRLMHPSYEHYDGNLDPIDKLLQRFILIRNIVSLWRTDTWSRPASVIRNLIQQLKPSDVHIIPSEFYSILEELEDLNQKTTINADEREIYSQSIRQLGRTLALIIAKPKDWFPALFWAIFVPLRYIDALKAKRPISLIVLAHYCVLIHHSPERWWMKGWSDRVLRSVILLLDESWKPYLSWARQAMQPEKELFCVAGESSLEAGLSLRSCSGRR
ncbi:hypothetical protein VTN96DRAFT_9094 [Rasamsonia emersonii]